MFFLVILIQTENQQINDQKEKSTGGDQTVLGGCHCGRITDRNKNQYDYLRNEWN